MTSTLLPCVRRRLLPAEPSGIHAYLSLSLSLSLSLLHTRTHAHTHTHTLLRTSSDGAGVLSISDPDLRAARDGFVPPALRGAKAKEHVICVWVCGCVAVCSALAFLSLYVRAHTHQLSLSLPLSLSLSLSLSLTGGVECGGRNARSQGTDKFSKVLSLVVLFSTHTGPLTFENVCQGQVTLYYYYYYSTIYIYIYTLSLSLSLSLCLSAKDK